MNIANTNATSQLYETTHFANYKIKLVRQGEGGRNRGRRERESDKEGLRQTQKYRKRNRENQRKTQKKEENERDKQRK